MANFDKYLQALVTNIKDFAAAEFEDHVEPVVEDGHSFIAKAKEDLKRWTSELAEGKLSAEDFEFLVKGKKDLAEMAMLKQAGLSQVRVVQCRQKLLDVIIKATIEFFA